MSVLVLLGAAGCGGAAYPSDLFIVNADAVDCPVMLSRTPSRDVGRSIQSDSGTHYAQTSTMYSVGSMNVSVVTMEQGQSEMSASDKFAAKVRHTDKWVEVDSVVFEAEDKSGFGHRSTDRRLELQGKAHP